ncbi:2715_t:CDS:2, partial [Diversispora eburnea]
KAVNGQFLPIGGVNMNCNIPSDNDSLKRIMAFDVEYSGFMLPQIIKAGT